MNNCRYVSEINILNKLYVLGLRDKIQYQVIDFNFSLVGLVVDNMYIPLPYAYYYNYRFLINEWYIPIIYTY
jgi:hypothetical protein